MIFYHCTNRFATLTIIHRYNDAYFRFKHLGCSNLARLLSCIHFSKPIQHIHYFSIHMYIEFPGKQHI